MEGAGRKQFKGNGVYRCTDIDKKSSRIFEEICDLYICHTRASIRHIHTYPIALLDAKRHLNNIVTHELPIEQRKPLVSIAGVFLSHTRRGQIPPFSLTAATLSVRDTCAPTRGR